MPGVRLRLLYDLVPLRRRQVGGFIAIIIHLISDSDRFASLRYDRDNCPDRWLNDHVFLISLCIICAVPIIIIRPAVTEPAVALR